MFPLNNFFLLTVPQKIEIIMSEMLQCIAASATLIHYSILKYSQYFNDKTASNMKHLCDKLSHVSG